MKEGATVVVELGILIIVAQESCFWSLEFYGEEADDVKNIF